MLRIGVHRANLLPNVIGRIREVDTVAKRLRHLLLTIGTRQTASRQVLGQQDIRLYQYRRIHLIETARQFACHLQHRLLILTGRNGRSLEQGDVGSLGNRVAEESEGDTLALEATHLDLSLHRRVALYTAHADEVHQISGQFGQLWNLALDEEHALLRIETSSQIVERHLDDVLTNLLGVIGIISQSLHISHKHKHTIIVARVLQLDTTAQRANIMSEMKFTCWAITSKNYFSHVIFKS